MPVQISRLLHAHEIVLKEAHTMARQAVENGDDGTNDLIVSDVIRTNELEVWFVGRTRRRHAGGTGQIGAPMGTTGNSAPEDSPAGEESGDNSRALVAAIAGVGAVISLATLVGALLRSS